MVLKKLLGTAQDLWRMRRMPAQVRAKDTRLAFTDIIVRHLSSFQCIFKCTKVTVS